MAATIECWPPRLSYLVLATTSKARKGMAKGQYGWFDSPSLQHGRRRGNVASPCNSQDAQRRMPRLETYAASYRVTGRDEDEDKRSTSAQTQEKVQAHTRFRSDTTGRGNTRSTMRTKRRRQTDRGAQGVKIRRRQGRHRVSSARTAPSITTHEGCHDTKRR